MLDGELVAHQGTPASFYRLGGRMATRRPTLRSTVPFTFVAFDVVWLDGDVTDRPLPVIILAEEGDRVLGLKLAPMITIPSRSRLGNSLPESSR